MPETSLSEKGLGAIGLGEDLEHLRDSVRGLLRRHISEDVVRNAVEAKEELLPTWWSALAQNGLLGLHLAEEHGGAGFGLNELVVVLEEAGRLLAPGPLVPTVLASAVLDAAGHTRFLAEIGRAHV